MKRERPFKILMDGDKYSANENIYVPYSWEEWGVCKAEAEALYIAGESPYIEGTEWSVFMDDAIEDYYEDKLGKRFDANNANHTKSAPAIFTNPKNLEYFRDRYDEEAYEYNMDILKKFERNCACVKIRLIKDGMEDNDSLNDYVLDNAGTLIEKYSSDENINEEDIETARKSFKQFRHNKLLCDDPFEIQFEYDNEDDGELGKDGDIYIPYYTSEFGISEKEVKAAAIAGFFSGVDVTFDDEPVEDALECVKDYLSDEVDNEMDDLDGYVKKHARELLSDKRMLKPLRNWFCDYATEWYGGEIEDFEYKCACAKVRLLRDGYEDDETLDEYILANANTVLYEYDSDVDLDRDEIRRARCSFVAFDRPGEINCDRILDGVIENEGKKNTDAKKIMLGEMPIKTENKSICLGWRPRYYGEPVPVDTYEKRMSLLSDEDRAGLERAVQTEKNQDSRLHYTFMDNFFGYESKDGGNGGWRDVANDCVRFTPDAETAMKIFEASAVYDNVRDTNGETKVINAEGHQETYNLRDMYKGYIDELAKVTAGKSKDWSKFRDAFLGKKSETKENDKFLSR